MKTVAFSGTPRESLGKKENKKLRKNNQVPAVLYGSKENINFSVEEITFSKLIASPHLYLINLTVGSFETRAIIQDVQFDPVTDRPIHVDFLEALPGKMANLSIPVKLSGKSAGVMAGGQLVLKMRRLMVKGVPADMPEVIDVDITDLQIGKSIKISDIKGFNFLDPENAVIVRVKAARNMAALTTDLEEGEEGEEGATEGAEGAEAAAEGAEAKEAATAES
jgi:large subunit ribosomal protein L25